MSAQKQEKDNRAEQQARAQLDSIIEKVARLDHIEECDGTDCQLSNAEIYGGIGLYWQEGKSEPASADERAQYHDRDEAAQSISEDPLSVEVRGGWQTPGSSEMGEPYEFKVLLCTGGPAVQIKGNLGQYNEPEDAELQYQDWFTPWETFYIEKDAEREALLTYCRQFYFGD